MKDELRSQEELSVAAVGYIPPVWAVLLLFGRWRGNYYTRYHLVHAAMLSLAQLLLLVFIGGITLLSSAWIGYSFLLTLITGLIIGISLLVGAGFILYCALSAYRGRYTVLPVVTRLYYIIFSQRAMTDNPYDSRRITHLRPYIKTQRDPSEH